MQGIYGLKILNSALHCRRNSVLCLKIHLLFKSNSISETAPLKLYLLHLCASLVSLI